MSQHSLIRALLVLLVAVLALTAVSPADAKRPRRYAGEVLQDWTLCRNGAELTIGATNERVKLVARSSRFGRERTLARVAITLREHPHTVWVLNEIPGDPDELVIDNPDTDPRATDDEVMPDDSNFPLGFARTVKVWWSKPAGRTVKIGLGPLDQDVAFATYSVKNCVFLGWDHGSFAALAPWLAKLLTFAQPAAGPRQ
jgi:hypothetical protein